MKMQMQMRRTRDRWGLLVLLVFVLPLLSSSVVGSVLASPAKKSLKVLAIGNSFSQDAMQHLYQIASAAGLEDVVVANLYIGGSSLEVHWSNAKHNLPRYRYDKNVDGQWRSQPNKSILYGLLDEEWDVITLQQVSGYSGIATTFTEHDRLQNLIDYVNEHKTNPDAKLAWHMTWAYQEDSTHQNFPRYNSNQLEMYQAIVDATQSTIVTNEAFDFIIPSGTAIQNVRTSHIGDTLTRDGYHLSLNLGRYIAGMVWVPVLTGLSIDEVDWVPNPLEVPRELLPLIKEAVNAAVENPFVITSSSYVEKPQIVVEEFDYADYTLLDWEPVGSAYWNSRNAAGLATTLISKDNSTASNLNYFVGSGRMFTREDLPLGTVIEVDEGYTYRPEGWVTLEQHDTREAVVATPRIVVTEDWWGNYEYRAFNLSLAGSKTDVSEIVEETASHLRIYIPKEQQTTETAEDYRALVPEVVAMKTTQEPIIDGNLDDQVWLDAAIYGSKLGGFVNHTGTALAKQDTIAYVAYDDENFYVAIVAFKSDMNRLVANARVHDTDVHKDDSVEVFWDTTHEHTSFHHIINNVIGTKSDVIVRDWSWSPEWEVATQVLDDRWISEIAIPFAEMGLTGAPRMGEVWGFNVNRNDISTGQHTGWATTYGSFLSPAFFGHLIFGGFLR